MDPSVVVVTSRSVAATQEALQHADHPVVGWLDLTSPNLVDLLDELRHGPGGHQLLAISAELTPGFSGDMPTVRGLSTLECSGIAVWLNSVDEATLSELKTTLPGLNLEGPYDSA